jgi:hypothetical protein
LKFGLVPGGRNSASCDPSWVDGYGRTWESWDVAGFVDLFSDGVVYVAHPEEIVVGREALSVYLRKEQAEQGTWGWSFSAERSSPATT